MNILFIHIYDSSLRLFRKKSVTRVTSVKSVTRRYFRLSDPAHISAKWWEVGINSFKLKKRKRFVLFCFFTELHSFHSLIQGTGINLWSTKRPGIFWIFWRSLDCFPFHMYKRRSQVFFLFFLLWIYLWKQLSSSHI